MPSPPPHASSSILFIVLLSLLLGLHDTSAAPSPASSSPTHNLWRSVLQLRSPSSTRPTYWSYKGLLRSAEDGSVLAEIHGLECCRTLSSGKFLDPVNDDPNKHLLVRKRLQRGDEFQSVISRKTFVYTQPGTTSPLTTWGRGGWSLMWGRQRKIDPRVRMDQIITVACKPNDTVLFHMQWPGNRELLTQQLAISEKKSWWWWSRLVGITSYVHPRSSQQQGNRWIAFGPPPPQRDGSLEYYNYAITPWSTEGQIRRFGEAPPWSGLQKRASTELRFRKHSSLRTVPRRLVDLVKQCDPTFFDMPKDTTEFAKLPDPRIRYLPWWKRIGHWVVSTSRCKSL